jgi:hypothetical protein
VFDAVGNPQSLLLLGGTSEVAPATAEAAPMSVTPEQVAEVIVDTVAKGREQAWAPAQMRFVMSVLRRLPRPVFRRLPV